MSDSFGARLRKHREERHVQLASIAEQTKIKISLFEELERDEVSRWPSGIFRRAYIRAYAHAIGLDPDVVVREFLEVHPDPGEVTDAVTAAATAGDRGAPPTRLRGIVDAAIGSFPWRQRSAPVSLFTAARPETESPADRKVGTPADSYPVPGPPVLAREEGAEVRGTCGKGATAAIAEPLPAAADFAALANLCTRLGRVATGRELNALLEEAASILSATGLIVWLWDATAGELRPAVAYGYSDKVLAQLPGVRPDADNATAAAFRLGQPCTMEATVHTNGALVVPLLTAAGCSGVLALELQLGERTDLAQIVATILASLLAQLIGGDVRTESQPDASVTGIAEAAS